MAKKMHAWLIRAERFGKPTGGIPEGGREHAADCR
jgi:hypothetical protein